MSAGNGGANKMPDEAKISTETKAPSGVTHLAMIICILLGVFIYAGWRVKSQNADGAQAQPAQAADTLHSMYDNLKTGLTGRTDRPTEVASSDQPVYAPVSTPEASGRATLSSAATQPASSLPPISLTTSAETGLEGLALPEEPTGQAPGLSGPSQATAEAVTGGEVGAISQIDRHAPSMPGAVTAPTGSDAKLKAVYERLKTDPILQSAPAPVATTTTPSKVSARSTARAHGRKLTTTTGASTPRANPATPDTTSRMVSVSGAGSVGSANLQRSPATHIVAESPTHADRANVAAEDTGEVMFYTVHRADTLARIAERFLGSRARAREIFEANRDQLSRPDTLRVGMRLRVPGAVRGDAPLIHVVRPSDSLPSLAVRYYGAATPDAIVMIRKANPALSHGGFKPGLRLVIPAPSSTATPLTEAAPQVTAHSANNNKPKVWVVKPGDNLRKIARSVYGDEDRWKEIFQANRSKLGSANTLYTGQNLELPQ